MHMVTRIFVFQHLCHSLEAKLEMQAHIFRNNYLTYIGFKKYTFTKVYAPEMEVQRKDSLECFSILFFYLFSAVM